MPVRIKRSTEDMRRIYAVIRKISITGEMIIQFSEPLIVPQSYQSFGSKQLNVYVISEDPSKLIGETVRWSITQFSSN